MIGSTYLSIPSRLSKSATAGIIFDRLCIFENTLTSGYESSNRDRIFLVIDFCICWTAFLLAAAAAFYGSYLISII